MEIAFVWLLGFAADAPFAIWLELTGDSLLNSIPRSLDKSLTLKKLGFARWPFNWRVLKLSSTGSSAKFKANTSLLN